MPKNGCFVLYAILVKKTCKGTLIHYRPEEWLEGGCLVPADEELPVGVVEEASDVRAAEGESCDEDGFDQVPSYLKIKLKLRTFSCNL